MPVIISMLRGINVGGYNKISMADLRKIYESLKLRDVSTYIQSGNVIFRSDEKDLSALANRIETAIEKNAGFRPAVIQRTLSEMKAVLAKNPFAGRTGIERAKVGITFFPEEPASEACNAALGLCCAPEEMVIGGREMYMYFPNGMGRPASPMPKVGKVLKVPGTVRNWNTVEKLIELAEKLEPAK